MIGEAVFMDKWDARFLHLALQIGDWSKDPSTKVGAVIVRPNRTISSVGFNGFPRGVNDTEDRLNNREEKYQFTLHAEMNAILSANEPVDGYTIYVSPLIPCSNCAAAIVQSGIVHVIAYMPVLPDRWGSSFAATAEMFSEAKVKLNVFDKIEY